jgi:hypothetical protein
MTSHTTRDILTLHEPNSHQFDVILVRATHEGGAGGDPLDVRIVFEMGWDTYDRTVQIFTLFHCPPDVRGQGPEGGLIAGKTVRVEARLDDALARDHFPDADAEGVVRRLIELRDTDKQHVLLETESWFALAVTQAADLPSDAPAGAELREGYRTSWMDARTVTRG